MNLAEVKSAGPKRCRQRRVGRGPGSGRGKTAGRGTKGQKSRSGAGGKIGHEGGQMPLYRRLPKRGFNNAKFRISFSIVNVGDLARFEDGAQVDLAAIRDAGIVEAKAERLKVLGMGTIEKKLTVKAQRFSASAKAKIESAGGRVEIVS